MIQSGRSTTWGYAIAVVGVFLVMLLPWGFRTFTHDTPPVRALLFVVVTLAAWCGGLGPGLATIGLGLLGLVVTFDMPQNPSELTQRLVRFGSLSTLITAMMQALHAARSNAEAKDLERRRSEERLTRLVETAGEGIWVIDALGRTTFANPRIGEMLGVSAQQLIGHRLEDYLSDSVEQDVSRWSVDLPTWHDARLRTIDGAEKHAIILTQRIDAEDFPKAALGTSVGCGSGMLLLVRDMTALKRAEDALRAERDFSTAVLETAGCLAVVLDREGRIVRFNRVCRELTGITDQEAIGRPLDDLFRTPDEAKLTRNAFEQVLAGRGSTQFESRWNTKTSGYRRVAWNNTTLEDSNGRVSYVIATGTDVTELRLAEEALREAKEMAEAANLAKDRFLAVLSHELRTPLTPALIAVSSLLESKPTPGLRASLEMIRRNIELEARLIDDLLDLSRIVRGRLRLDLEVVDIHQTIRQAVEICRNDALVSGIIVMTELNAEHHHVIADHARLMQIVWNLIRNALKFTPSGGRLTISSQCTTETSSTGTDELGQIPSVHGISVEFRDTGIGIEPALLRSIFNAFEQSREDLRSRSGGGLGLGLAISKSLAEALGGSLSATSPGLGLGSTFRLELATVAKPARARDTASNQTSATSARSTVSRRMKILLLEDNEDTLRFLAIVLRQHGHEVATAERVAEAHSLIANAETPFDLLISDIELPDGSGLHLMCDLGRGHDLPGIAMSGFGTEEDVKLSHEAGFLEHLTKPVDIHRLEAAIQRAATLNPERYPHEHASIPAEATYDDESIISADSL